jgi:hypothetical protein
MADHSRGSGLPTIQSSLTLRHGPDDRARLTTPRGHVDCSLQAVLPTYPLEEHQRSSFELSTSVRAPVQMPLAVGHDHLELERVGFEQILPPVGRTTGQLYPLALTIAGGNVHKSERAIDLTVCLLLPSLGGGVDLAGETKLAQALREGRDEAHASSLPSIKHPRRIV